MAQYDLPQKSKRIELKAPARPVVTQPPVPAAPVRVSGDPRGMTQHIREMAIKYGISPEVALKVAKSEGLAQFLGDNGASGGAFQLYTKGGLGNEFQKETGLDPLDPANEKATIEYAMKRASQGGWGPWYGAAKVGVGKFEGIGAGTGGAGTTTDFYSGNPVPAEPDAVSTTTKPDEDKTVKDEKKKTNWGEAAGEGLEAVGKAYAAGAKNQASSPANVPVPSLPIPQPPAAMVDAKRAEMQRQQLAIAMQRLNSGRLV